MDEEIIMLFDSMSNQYRPLWKKEWDVEFEVLDDEEQELKTKQFQPYVATDEDIDQILEAGNLEWNWNAHGSEWYVLIRW